ncbi:MAG: hypothetical protein A3F74_08875 [Betaproteobacteria bacterium RIFCSPLOWO2_12_FULL_62_58]|nr:MAG: hypothetical protein A3F74_08875 [Betaproteobacteria bacterium RIFCSPLOWO2_12_FULL_62_58]
MRIAINASSLLSPATGIASYTRNLAQALLESGKVEAFFFYGVAWSRGVRDVPLPAAMPVKSLVRKLVPYAYEVNRFVQQRMFNAGVARYQPDVYHDPNYLAFSFDGPVVITIHDMSHIRYPEMHPESRVNAMNKYLPPSIALAVQIIVDSEFVKSEVVNHFGVDPARVHAIHLGVAGHYTPRRAEESASALMPYGLAYRAYILAVGTLEPRKNLIQAIDAYAGLPEAVRKSTPLVIAGMKGWLTEELQTRIRKYEDKGEVRWLGYVPGEVLPVLYSGARFLVYPSLYEGFGLPVLEAMASGIPVITSNRASLPEVAGEAAIVVDPDDREALREAMLRMLEDEQEAKRRSELGLAQAARFTWRACAEKTLAVYRKAISES